MPKARPHGHEYGIPAVPRGVILPGRLCYTPAQHQERGVCPGQPAPPGKVARAERRGCGRKATKRVKLSDPSGARIVARRVFRFYLPHGSRAVR